MSTPKTISIDSIEYIRADSVPASMPTRNRHVVVIDRGWIYAGDLTEENGRIYLARPVWVFKWQSCGFAAVLEDPSKADIRPVNVPRIDLPAGAEIYRVPVPDTWGVK